MLQELIIENLALLKHIKISFDSGMTCLTGETGAGKSIMLDAIELAKGERCDPSLIPANQKAQITAVFKINNNQTNQAYKWLIDNNFLPESKSELNNCTISRIIENVTKNNQPVIKSKAFINTIPATLQQLKQLGQLLIYIHGQHEHLNLLKESNQLKILDTYGRLDNLANSVNQLYKQWAKAKQELQTKIAQQSEYQSKKQLLEFQISELEAANLIPDEWQSLNQQYQWLANQEEYTNNLTKINFILDESELERPSVNQQLNQILNILTNIQSDQPVIANIAELINNSLININEASYVLQSFLAKLESDPESMDILDKRISKLQDLARKYKTTPDELNFLYTQCLANLQELESQTDLIFNLKNNLIKLEQEYKSIAELLSQQRKTAANKLSQELTRLLQNLRMQGALLSIILPSNNNPEPSPYGLESCLFLVKTNSDQSLTPLSQGVSGGELSRIVLATQVVTAEVEGTPSLIFDEVDVGIGGGTAQIVGQLLSKIGNSTQVMCVTHLAQVASQADHHIKVSKAVVNNITTTQIEYLNYSERIEELARMIGGLTITKQTLAHAQELLEAVTQ
ncbi:MAG: DNA repair protein RecN [Gammaproteobacteria bacterium]|nr:DNA repair protein RecN [Gammaproteobacteria bacterium]